MAGEKRNRGGPGGRGLFLTPPGTIGLYARWRTDHPCRVGYSGNGCVVNRFGTRFDPLTHAKGILMNSIVYLVGAVVIIVAILSFLGLR
jgi:hypothetical protein